MRRTHMNNNNTIMNTSALFGNDNHVALPPPRKKQRTTAPVSSFIGLEQEDWYRPSHSGLELLNCRTFVEGLRLTVVRGDITESETDAIVVPSDERLSLTGMVGSAVRQKTSPAFVAEVNNARRLYAKPIMGMRRGAVPAPHRQQQQQRASPPYGNQLPHNTVRLENAGAARTIREIAAAANVSYLTAFYKVVKKENIPATKDIIYLDGMGGYHRGATARALLGLYVSRHIPSVITTHQIPAGAEVFVQNTSHNRKIPNNSSILLETPVVLVAPPPPPQIPAAMTAAAPLKTSDACVVYSHDLVAPNVILVVSPHFDQQPSRAAARHALKLTVKNALRECSRLQLGTVTLPSIGSGVAGYDKAEAAGWIIDAIAEYLEESSSSSSSNNTTSWGARKTTSWQHHQPLQEVCFCLFDDESLEAYRRGILAHEN